jgi:hypothetical protein
MKKSTRWLITIALLFLGCYLLTWAVQTAWIGSFPGQDKSKYGFWAALQLGGGLVCVFSSLGIWIKFWFRKK